MYNYIIGKIMDSYDDVVIIENNLIGYEIHVSNITSNILQNAEGDIKIFIYYNQKEDGVTLYGFCDKFEKDIFLKLISVSGVGPKGAMSILSNISPQEFCKVIASQDLTSLSSVKGVGKKTAERLLVELKDKIDAISDFKFEEASIKFENTEINDACEVLISLGLSKNEAYKLAKECYKQGDSAEDIISKSLFLMKK